MDMLGLRLSLVQLVETSRSYTNTLCVNTCSKRCRALAQTKVCTQPNCWPGGAGVGAPSIALSSAAQRVRLESLVMNHSRGSQTHPCVVKSLACSHKPWDFVRQRVEQQWHSAGRFWSRTRWSSCWWQPCRTRRGIVASTGPHAAFIRSRSAAPCLMTPGCRHDIPAMPYVAHSV